MAGKSSVVLDQFGPHRAARRVIIVLLLVLFDVRALLLLVPNVMFSDCRVIIRVLIDRSLSIFMFRLEV